MEPESNNLSSKPKVVDMEQSVAQVVPAPVTTPKTMTPVPEPQPQPAVPVPMSPGTDPEPEKKSGKRKYIIVGLLIGAILVLIWWLFIRKTPPISNTPVNQSSTEVTPENLSGYGVVCTGRKVAGVQNTAGKVRPVALFEDTRNVQNSYSFSSINLGQKDWQSTEVSFKETQIVGCMSVAEEVETGTACTLKDVSGKTVSLKQVDVTYDFRLIEVSSGNQLAKTSIAAKSGACPTFADYNEEDKKLLATPDTAKLVEIVRPHAQP